MKIASNVAAPVSRILIQSILDFGFYYYSFLPVERLLADFFDSIDPFLTSPVWQCGQYEVRVGLSWEAPRFQWHARRPQSNDAR
jgi:hypothetical protein